MNEYKLKVTSTTCTHPHRHNEDIGTASWDDNISTLHCFPSPSATLLYNRRSKNGQDLHQGGGVEVEGGERKSDRADCTQTTEDTGAQTPPHTHTHTHTHTHLCTVSHTRGHNTEYRYNKYTWTHLVPGWCHTHCGNWAGNTSCSVCVCVCVLCKDRVCTCCTLWWEVFFKNASPNCSPVGVAKSYIRSELGTFGIFEFFQ